MINYYLMAKKVPENATIIRQKSHPFAFLKSGDYMGEDFEEPFVCRLVDRFANGVMPTFYMSPAIIGTKQFYQDLLTCGVDNIETKSVVIEDHVNNRMIEDYLLLNIIGRVSCVVLDRSDYGTIGEGMNVMNKIVIDSKKVKDRNLFLLEEDTHSIIVNEYVYRSLNKNGYQDIFFEELEQV